MQKKIKINTTAGYSIGLNLNFKYLNTACLMRFISIVSNQDDRMLEISNKNLVVPCI